MTANDFDGAAILAGVDGGPAKIVDVRVSKTANDALVVNFYVEVGSKLLGSVIEDGTEPIPATTVAIEEWPVVGFNPEDEKQRKKLERFNSVLSKLTNEKIAGDDDEAWCGLVEGGPLHAKIIGATCFVGINDYNGRKKFQFALNASKPAVVGFKDLISDFRARKAKEQESSMAALAI